MAQFECDYCGKGFEQKSAYERHLQTSHPKREPSAADVEKALAGVSFPAGLNELLEAAKTDTDDETLGLLTSLPDREYRDAAEVAKALGEIIGHAPHDPSQPSVKGGNAALGTTSAAKIASLLRGIDFPASKDDLKNYVRPQGDDDVMAVLERFRDRTYDDMADVTREFGRATESQDRYH